MTFTHDPFWRIHGGPHLTGTVHTQGSKNAGLAAIAASLLANGPTRLSNVPRIADVDVSVEILNHLGAHAVWSGPDELTIDPSGLSRTDVPLALSSRSRGAVLFLGALLARTGEASLGGLGGCDLGERKLDFHIEGFRRLGAVVDESAGNLRITGSHLLGTDILLQLPSHTGTENMLLAAVGCEGTTQLINCAVDPEVRFLAQMLAQMGASVDISNGAATVIGGRPLGGADVVIPPDRIDAGTWMLLSAAAGGEVIVEATPADQLQSVIYHLRSMGVAVNINGPDVVVRRDLSRPLAPSSVMTWPFPGFPTDLQALLMVVQTQADGISAIRERVFDRRFAQVPDLRNMNAKIEIYGETAEVQGPTSLSGAVVRAPDLRAGASLVAAAVVADGTSDVHGVDVIRRGYVDFPQRLAALGVHVEEAGLPLVG